MKEVIGEVFLDDIPLITTADNEIIYAMRGIELHDVPQDRPTAYFNHGFWLEVGFFRYTSSKTAGENDSLQNNLPFIADISLLDASAKR